MAAAAEPAGPSAVGPGVSNCTALFRVNATGVQCHDLRQTLAETPAECAGACCADSGCDTWQWSTSVLAGCCWLVFAPPLLVPVLLLLRQLRLLLESCTAAAAAAAATAAAVLWGCGCCCVVRPRLDATAD